MHATSDTYNYLHVKIDLLWPQQTLNVRQNTTD